ncbi:MAG: AAA family ATPase [Lentisphaeria bacterium]|nr:AAA family ATPase [Lentisphaeria bacterium]
MIDNKTIESLKLALEASPSNIPLHIHIADLYCQREEFDHAETLLRNALKFEPDHKEVKLQLSKVYGREGKFSIALVLIEELLEADKNNAQFLEQYASLLAKTGQSKEAIKVQEEIKRKGLNEEDSSVDFLNRAIDVVEGRERILEDTNIEEGSLDIEPIQSDTDFSDVGGMEKVKDEIRIKIILPLTNQDLYKAYGKKAGGGILLYGPPGCGKTFLAKATAGEVKAQFMSVGLNDILNMWIGQSEERLHNTFEMARKQTPSVLFFDEVDALGAKRSDMRQSSGRHLINQFLSELDGVDTDNEGVLVLAATNAPWHLDTAFRRPGRFDRIIFVPPPDETARTQILKLMTKEMPQDKLDLIKVARKCDGFSGADLKAVVDIAVEDLLRTSIKSGKVEPITTKHLLKASKQVPPSTKEWFATARNHAIYANEAGLYDDVLSYLNIKR